MQKCRSAEASFKICICILPCEDLGRDSACHSFRASRRKWVFLRQHMRWRHACKNSVLSFGIFVPSELLFAPVLLTLVFVGIMQETNAQWEIRGMKMLFWWTNSTVSFHFILTCMVEFQLNYLNISFYGGFFSEVHTTSCTKIEYSYLAGSMQQGCSMVWGWGWG